MESIILNDFRVQAIREVIDEIESNLTVSKDLLIHNCLDEKNDTSKLATLSYHPYLHRLDATYFNPHNNPLYPNPSCICSIMPKETFIKSIIPSKEYHQIFKD